MLRPIAYEHDDPITAAAPLLHLRDATQAERRLVSGVALIDGNDYGRLISLADAFDHTYAHADFVANARARHGRKVGSRAKVPRP